MTTPLDLNNALLEIMRDVHVIKSALYLDTTVVGNLNVTRQIGRLNELTEKLLGLYEKTTGSSPPPPAAALKPVAPGTLRNFDSRKLRKPKPEVEEKPVPAKRGRKPRQKTPSEKIADKLKELDKQAKKKQQKKRYAKTRKVRGARKGNPGQTPP